MHLIAKIKMLFLKFELAVLHCLQSVIVIRFFFFSFTIF